MDLCYWVGAYTEIRFTTQAVSQVLSEKGGLKANQKPIFVVVSQVTRPV